MAALRQVPQDDGDMCVVDPEAALEALHDTAVTNIIRGAATGDAAKVAAAAKIRKATEAAAVQDPSERAGLANDVSIKSLADCLAAAETADEVDECMLNYCDADTGCLVDYADNSCSEEEDTVGAEPAKGKGIFRRLLGWLRR